MQKNMVIPKKDILHVIAKYDAAETMKQEGRWPRNFAPKHALCPQCGEKLSPLSKRAQKSNSDKQLLVTKLHIIQVDILSRKCNRCYLEIRADTLAIGLLNIGDVTLVALDVFFTLQNTIR